MHWYWDNHMHMHILFHEGLPFISTSAFMSINSHLGNELSHTELGVLCIFWNLLCRLLSWFNGTLVKKRAILHMKQTIPAIELYEMFPSEHLEFLEYSHIPSFTEKPNYVHVQSLFCNIHMSFNSNQTQFKWQAAPHSLVMLTNVKKYVQWHSLVMHNTTCATIFRPITITPLFATPGTCYHGHHSSILSSAQVLCRLLVPFLSIIPRHIVHWAIPLPLGSGLFPIIPTTIIIITIQPSSLADWEQSAFKSCADAELCSALGWDLNFPRPSSYVSHTWLVRTGPYYQFPESQEPGSCGRLAGLTLFCF